MTEPPSLKKQKTNDPDPNSGSNGRSGPEQRTTSSSSSSSSSSSLSPGTNSKSSKTVPAAVRVALENLPCGDMYEWSYMHKDKVTVTSWSTPTAFCLSGSEDGEVRFWAKSSNGSLDFVKTFRSHKGPVVALPVTLDGRTAASVSKADSTLNIFDVGAFDLITALTLDDDFLPSDAVWISSSGAPAPRIALASSNTPQIVILAPTAASGPKILESISAHTGPVRALAFNPVHSVVCSGDVNGVLEVWDAASPNNAEPRGVGWNAKLLETDLFDLAKASTAATSIAFSPNGLYMAVMDSKSNVRVFSHHTGKLLYRSPPPDPESMEMIGIDAIDYGRRLALEGDIESSGGVSHGVVWDESSNVLAYTNLAGITLLAIAAPDSIRVLGSVESSERFSSIALYQGRPPASRGGPGAAAAAAAATKSFTGDSSKAAAGSGGGGGGGGTGEDPTFAVGSWTSNRVFLFSRREPSDEVETGRDIFNEKPTKEEILAASGRRGAAGAAELPHSATIHTTLGDIGITLFPEQTPRTVENFAGHSRNGYYEGLTWHRVIKGFMVQTGCPIGDGTGGVSIWGGDFEDEIRPGLLLDRPFTVAMANSGPNTNGSQFFITTAATPWLDKKHTVFGRVVTGVEVVKALESVQVDKKTDKPREPMPRIVSISLNNDKKEEKKE